MLYLLWSRLSLQQSDTLIASIHYSALFQLHCTPKLHRNNTRLRIAMKCVSADQVVGEGWWRLRRGGTCGPLCTHHLFLIALVLRLRVSRWSLMHARNNVFTCSSCIMHGPGEATVLWRNLCPQVLCFLFVRACVRTCLCVSWFTFSQAVKSTFFQAPQQESDGASDNKQ